MEILKFCNDRIVDSPHISFKRNGGMAGSLIQGGSSILGSVLGFLTNENTNDLNDIINQRQIQASKDMLKSEQDYNTHMMQNQKQMQMQDAKQAGVNPAFAQGSQIGNQSPSPSGSVPSPIPMRSYDWNNIAGLGESINQFLLQKKMVEAQAENLYADTYKKMAETDRQRIENKYLPSLLQGQVNMIESNISVNGSVINKNEWEAKNFAQNILESNKRMQKIEEEIKVYQQEVANMKVDERIKKIEEYWKSDECRAGIESLMASAACSRAQAQDIYATQASRIMLLDNQAKTELERKLNIHEDTKNLKQQNRVIKITGDRIDFDLKSDKKYKNRERAMGLINGVVNSANNIVSGIKSVTGVDKAGSVIGSMVSGAPPASTGHGYTFNSSR